ncbi:hypothetical protein [Aeromonas phage phiWae15]|nr:hypothetical protein [Aeromonas phage phiWae15]
MSRVLIACERFGVIRDAFIKAGHDAVSCDLVDTAIPGPHYTGDVRDILDDGWDLMIAHPDCTYLCSSGLHWNHRVPGRAKLTEEALDFVRLLMAAPISRIAIENPMGRIGTAIRKADQTIQPYEFGDNASKRTGLWLKNLPLLKPTKYVEPRLVCQDCKSVFTYGNHKCLKCGSHRYLPRWDNQTDSGQNKLGPSDDRAMLRAKTYQGWADAMADQWGRILKADDEL